jgi:hypothetical protein
MQGSATILPQKNSSRKNIYVNQNTNTVINTAHIRKESAHQLNLNPNRAKSPIDKVRITNVNFTGYPTQMASNLTQMTGNQAQMMMPSAHFNNQMVQ